MKYMIQRAVKTELGVFNIGDEVLLIFDDGRVDGVIEDFYWIDEYTAGIELNNKRRYNLDKVVSIIKAYKA